MKFHQRLESIKKVLRLKNTISEIKTSLDEFNSIAEDSLNDPEDRSAYNV